MKYFIRLLAKLSYKKCKIDFLLIFFYLIILITLSVDAMFIEHPVFTVLSITFTVFALLFSLYSLYRCIIQVESNRKKINVYKHSKKLKRALK